MRALTGKEWDPENWDGDVWEDPKEAGGHRIPILPAEAALPPLSDPPSHHQMEVVHMRLGQSRL